MLDAASPDPLMGCRAAAGKPLTSLAGILGFMIKK